MYLISDWIVDGINNKLYKFTNDIIEGVYNINIANPIGDAGVVVSTDKRIIGVTCPTAGMIAWFDAGIKEFIRYTSIGGMPTGICEGIPYNDDRKIPYFVCNYSTDSVSIIKEGSVVQTITVGKGPKSIACDGYGRVYVSNFNSSNVSILALGDNNKYNIYKTITVDKFPNCLAINNKDDLFVVCQSSIYKIRKDNTKVKFTITGNPANITADKYGNMWVTNIADNSVLKISLQEKITSYISGGVGPVYISSDKNGDVICLNTGDKTITRINEDGDVINTIQLNFIPIANSDFIGYMSRINILDDSQTPKKISYDDLDENLKERIDSGGVDPETLIIKSDNITYNSAGFSNVTEAINSLIYERSGLLSSYIEEFNTTPPIVEIGSTISSLTFNYHINNHGDPSLTIAEINNGIGVVPIDNSSYVATGLSISEDTEYKFTLTNNTMNIGEKTTTVKFDKKLYFGINNTIINTSMDILSLDSMFVEDNDNYIYEKKIIFNNGNGYLYIAAPSILGITIDDIDINGIKDSNWETSEINVTNSSGYIEMYTLFRSGSMHDINGYKIFVNINHIK